MRLYNTLTRSEDEFTPGPDKPFLATPAAIEKYREQIASCLVKLQALAQVRTLTQAPIHIMSGMNDDEMRTDARLLGASGFFGKPLDLPAILAAIDAI